jgi:c-di-GMP-binding flagellar brake protein YcgR
MLPNGKERRRLTRCYFGKDENVKAIFSIADEEQNVITNLMDISEGGMSVAFIKSGSSKIKNGDTLTLKEITGFQELSFLYDIDNEIKWLVNIELLNRIALGCEFIAITDATRDRIRDFVNHKIVQPDHVDQ